VFNMFVQHSIGEYRFSNIDAFENGIASTVYYGNGAGTHNPADAAANFGYATHTLYAQDEYYIYDMDMTITYGLRYDWYSSSDEPRGNENFVNRYGFANNTTFDGESLLQPRVGVNWNLNDNIELRGGVGLYSGGNPNVWLANGYQNDGVTAVQLSQSNVDLFSTPLSGEGRPLFDIPQNMYDSVTNANGDSAVNAVDPNFKLPKEWKYAIGGTYTFDEGTVVMADILYSIAKDQSIVRDIAMEQVGTLFDGRPVYASKEGSRREDFLLTNASEDAKKLTFSTSVSKNFDFGLDLSLAYAYTESEDANPMTSSVAYSNFTNFARSDFNNPESATSNYEIPHRFTFRASYNVDIVDGYTTTISLLGSHNKGRPYSYTFEGSLAGDYSTGRQLLYVPTGADDPNVVWGADEDGVPFDTDAFFAFVNESGLSKYSGRIAERNGFTSDWWTKVDLRVTQELPGFMEGHKAKAFFVIDNLTNLLNDDWGVLYEATFPQSASVVEATVNDEGQYVFNAFTNREPQARVTTPSLWRMTLGIEYKF